VIPAFNERDAIHALAGSLGRLAEFLEVEFIVVDDGSTDGTAAIAQSCPGLRCVTLARSGKTAALHAGFRAARHAIIVTLDADLQEYPEEIPDLVMALEGADLVYGLRVHRMDSYFRKILPSRIYNRVIALAFGRDFGDINCGLRAMRREIALTMPTFDGAHRLFPLIVHKRGGTVTSRPIRHRARATGRSKFSSPARFLGAMRDLARVAVENHAR
jgi:glycosyltransferase involved in cell wall biosynthesis